MLWGVSVLKSSVFQKTDFSRFLINRTRCSIDWNCDKNFDLSKIFFMHHLCLGFTCIALFLYPSYSFAVISLNVFTHNMHTLCYIGYSTWSKNWLINFWVLYFLVYVFFYVWTVKNIFLKRYDNQCANIFSTYATVYGSHSIKFAFIKRENIFLHVYPQIINLIF